MKAIIYRRYAMPPALEMAHLPEPTAGPGEVLVRVEAASLNPMDIGISSGAVKAISGNRFPKRLGADFSGEVVGHGDGIADLQAGDEVFGYLADLQGTNGTFAEYLAVKASRMLGSKSTGKTALAMEH
jgi:NADPH:quinone reductase-like Zn-dependent oxidoreductase